MWREIRTDEEWVSVSAPFSFFFDLVRPLWRSQARIRANVALHRVCTLARKMGVRTVAIEPGLSRPEVREEIDDLDQAHGGSGEAEAVVISFFDCPLTRADVASLSDDRLLGQATVINYRPKGHSEYSVSYVFEAVMRIPSIRDTDGVVRSLLNNYVHSAGEFEISACGRVFNARAVYYCQQNGVTSVCAHACLRMTLNTVLPAEKRLTTRSINQLLAAKPPFSGLRIEQIKDVLAASDFRLVIYLFEDGSPEAFDRVLYSIVESGHPALLTFRTSDADTDHIIPVYGHTLNTDEWHPEAQPAYAAPAATRHYSSSSWTDHFLIHDDNFGPYYCLSRKSFDTPPMIPRLVIGLFPMEIGTLPILAEVIASGCLRTPMALLAPGARGNWARYLGEHDHSFVLRTLLVQKSDYLTHLADSCCHDGSKINAGALALLAQLPDRFWMTEFSLPSLYTGNRSKLGEVICEAMRPVDVADLQRSVLAIRVPEHLLLRDGSSWLSHPCSLAAHSPLIHGANTGWEW